MIKVGPQVMDLTLMSLAAATTLLVALTALARIRRMARDRRLARRLQQVRPALFALLDDEELYDPTSSSPDLDTLVLSLLPQLRGADRDQLTLFLDDRGVLARARRALAARTALTRAEATELLGGAGDPLAAGSITGLLADRDHRVRNTAARALGRLGAAAGAGALLTAAQDPRRPVPRSTTGMALLRIGAPAAPAMRAELSSEIPALRALCAELLGHLGDLPAQPALLTLSLTDSDETVRTAACGALGRIGSPSSTPILAGFLSPSEPESVRHASAWALGAIGDPRAIPPLQLALHDADVDVATTAAQAINDIDPDALGRVDCCLAARRHADAAMAFAAARGNLRFVGDARR